MSSIDNFELTFKRLKQEMEHDASILNEKKSEKQKLQEEITNFKQQNEKEMREIDERKRKIPQDEAKIRELEREIRKLEDKHRTQHLELSRVTASDRERLEGHGIKLPPKNL
ncbi:MAG TPA: hypothetical protein VJJ28_00525 [Candidatus Paceibacterota bacterium]